MDIQGTLLQALHANPADDVAWLALADSLEERGKPERAELLRLHRAPRHQPAGPERETSQQRLRDLLAAGTKPCVPLLSNSIGMTFALVAPGTFLMGSPSDEHERNEDEGPVHEAELTRPFYLGVHPVTQE